MNATQTVMTRLLLAASFAVLSISSAFAANGTWDVNANGNWSTTTNWFSGIVADGSGSTANFTNTITANRTVTLDGDRTLTNLVFGVPFTPYAGNAGSWTLSGSGNLTLTGTNPGITVHNLGTGNVARISSIIEGTNGLVKSGSGQLTLNGSAVNTFTGGLAVNAGTLRLDYANLGTPTNLVDSGNALSLGGGALQVHAKASATSNQTFNGVTVAAGGGSILATNNSATNVTNISLGALDTSASGGSLLVGTNVSAGTAGLTITTTTNKDAQDIYGGRVVFWNGTANTGYDWATTASVSSPYTLSGLTSYTTLPSSGGSGTVNYNMTAGTTLAGSFSVNSLKLQAPGGNLVLGSNLLTIESGGLLMTGTTNRSITGTAGATRLTAGAGSNYQLIIHQYNSGTTGLTISNAVIGNNGANAVSLVKAGTGILTLSVANTYTGQTFVNAGQLNIGNNTALGATAGNTVVASGATVYATSFTVTAVGEAFTLNGIGSLASGEFQGALRIGGGVTATYSGAITLGSDSRIRTDGGTTVSLTAGVDTAGHALQFTSNSADFNINSVGISGTGGSVVVNNISATAPINFNATNSYTGSTTLNQGVINVGASGTLSGSAASLAVNNTNTGAGTDVVLNLSTGSDTTVGSLSGTISTPLSGTNNATINTQTGRTFTVNQTTAGTYAGVIAGPGGFTLGSSSNNTLTLTGTNTYTGATNVDGGSLLVNGSLAAGSVVTVGAGGMLGGNGTINGATTVNGLLAPGNSPGILTFNGSLTLAGNTTLEIDGTATRGVDFDGVNTVGLLTYGGALSFDFGTTLPGNETFDLFDIGGGQTGNFSSVSLSGLYSGSMSLSGGNWTLTDGGGNNWTFSQATGDLTFIAVPEPTTFALLAAGGAMGFGLLRRRR
jgi:autotransporter-associated beta strand protein